VQARAVALDGWSSPDLIRLMTPVPDGSVMPSSTGAMSLVSPLLIDTPSRLQVLEHLKLHVSVCIGAFTDKFISGCAAETTHTNETGTQLLRA